MIDDTLYWYKAKILSVYDGDSIHAEVDLGMNIAQQDLMLRIKGIDAPEIRGEEREEGLKAEERLRELIGGELVVIRTYKDSTGKYGRYICEVFVPESGRRIDDYDHVEEMVNVGDQLVEEGFAEHVNYS